MSMTPEDREIDRLDEELKKLRHAYEKYFMGLERLEPLKDRDSFKKDLRRMIGSPIRNTALRFRLQNLQASLVTHESYWNRIARQIEEGNYKRDRWRADKLMAERNTDVAGQSHERQTADATEQEPSRTQSTNGAQAGPPASGAAGQTAPSTTSDDRFMASVRRLHEAFEATRQQLGATTPPVSLESMATTVRRQTAALKARYACNTVEFRVAVKNSRPVLKAIPK